MSSSELQRSIIPVFIVIIIVGVLAVVLSVDNSSINTRVDESKQIQINTNEDISTTRTTPTDTIESPEDKSTRVKNQAEISPEDHPDNLIDNAQTTTEQLSEITETRPEKKFIEGLDYVTKFPNELPKEPVLMEFFSFMCPACFNFEPTIKRWELQKPDTVKLVKIPVTFGRSGSWTLAAKAFYIAEELEISKQFNPLMFRKIHLENKPPRQLSDLEDIFLTLGIKSKAFKKAANSFNVDSKLRKAEFLTKKYLVSGVPYFLINGKYEAGTRSFESEQSLFHLWNKLPSKDF